MAPCQAANPAHYFGASAASAIAFFPLWKAAAIGQSGYAVAGNGYWSKYIEAMKPPWRGSIVVIAGMTWARAAIFYGSDVGSRRMNSQGFGAGLSATVPSLIISSFSQIVNQPIVRISIMLQRPGEELASRLFPSIAMMNHLVATRGIGSLWVGLDAALLRTVPKYTVAVVIKDYMGEYLAPVDAADRRANLIKSAKISVTAGVAGAVLTNPLDVIRNEMFKTDERMIPCAVRVSRESGARWLARGIGKNWVAVAAPIASTIFLTDMFRVWYGPG